MEKREAVDRSAWTKADLKAYVRANKIGPDGTSPGPTSWCEAVSPDRVREVLAACDRGETLSHAVNGAGDVGEALASLNAALAAALAKPAGVDEAAVRRIAREVAATVAGDNGTLRIEVRDFKGTVRNVGTQHPNFPRLLALLSAGIPTLAVGPRGSGKSHGVHAAADALGFPFYADSFSLDSGRHDVFGFMDAQSRYVSTAFRSAYAHGGVYCADEIDNGTASLQAAFNLALSNGKCRFPDSPEAVEAHETFRFAGTLNTLHGATLSYTGREALDMAFMDRCAVVQWDVDAKFERKLAVAHFKAVAGEEADATEAAAWATTVARVRTVMGDCGMDRHAPSPRASINGARMLASGMPLAEVLEVFVVKGADADARTRIEGASK